MIVDVIKNRRSARIYKPDPVAEKDVLEVIRAAQFAPTAMNKRGIEFLVIKDQETKEAINEILVQQYLKEAPVLLVPVANEKCVLPVQDLSIASDHIFLQASALGLGTVWKNVSPELSEKIKTLLNIPANFHLINIIPLGYSAQELPPHGDEEFFEEKIHVEKW
jgi:nitroreductase